MTEAELREAEIPVERTNRPVLLIGYDRGGAGNTSVRW
jgi:hypothetical protein